jgi:hypothetical protein
MEAPPKSNGERDILRPVAVCRHERPGDDRCGPRGQPQRPGRGQGLVDSAQRARLWPPLWGSVLCVCLRPLRGADPHPSQQQQLVAGGLSLDDLTRRFIRDRLAYRFVVTADGTEAARLEAEVRRGALSVGRPYLNPLEPPWS